MRQLVVTIPVEFEEQVVKALQNECQLKNITRSTDGSTSKITCYVAALESGVVLHELDKVGCGSAYGKVALLPVHLLKPLPNLHDRHLTLLVKQSTWRLQGRMATEEIYTNVASGTELSFDYLAFVVVAGLIAAVGLATNSSVMIVASMLVSPLMGPILAFSFGTTVQDSCLVKKGLLAELAGLLLTFTVGLVVGFAVCIWTGVAHDNDWPTAEMRSRGEITGLVSGVFFAVPSGAGVALSTTQGGTNALVGVAIAASLLPPVVNSGLCLAFAIAGAKRSNYEPHTFYHISWLSFVLFLINVASIYVVCLVFFWIKDVKKVRKQLSRYRDLPPVKLKAAAADMESGANRRPLPASPSAVASGNAGGSHGPVVSASAGEVVIKVGSDSALHKGSAGVATRGPSPVGSHVESVGSSGLRASMAGMLGALIRGSPTATPVGSVRGGAQGPPPEVKGWHKVRKVVMEDGTLKEIIEAAEVEEEAEAAPQEGPEGLVQQEQQQQQENKV